MSKRPTIGRQLNSQVAAEDRSSTERIQYFTLKTGRKVKFTFLTIPALEVSEKTFVIQETNGRDQSALTKESLKDITETIKFQQFYSCIGVWNGDRIEILDGSRRRASAILVHVSLDVMVTSDPLSAEEARHLAKSLQTAKEHNLREIGLRLLTLKDSGLNQKQIAEQEGMSQAKVTRAMQAASVPKELISIFPVQSELSFSDYKTLLDIDENLKNKNISYQELINTILKDLDEITTDLTLAEDEQKAAVLKLITRTSQALIAPPPKEKVTISPLWSFDDKDKFARKRVKGRNFSYEFSRLSKEVQQDIDEAINGILQRHLSD
ncbi:ParB/RepB/Spo0J family partition protein [Salmonella enterica subsp. enterica serovar Legon]|nr:ParB/RepB/Spo0J family partition protein [Salmonella enterica subsp. enterica serovar Legon]EDW9825370.1 ParB/RepB/Spo0J family partition protein [Salmonella enterica]EDZ3589420.1 ParB/RepB/Spo0J family partition protein [Salmonella enterica subsp. enterica serovar Wagenia]